MIKPALLALALASTCQSPTNSTPATSLEEFESNLEHLREAGEKARTAGEDARAAADAARQAAMEAVRATADTLHATLGQMEVVEELRRTLRDLQGVTKLDPN